MQSFALCRQAVRAEPAWRLQLSLERPDGRLAAAAACTWPLLTPAVATAQGAAAAWLLLLSPAVPTAPEGARLSTCSLLTQMPDSCHLQFRLKLLMQLTIKVPICMHLLRRAQALDFLAPQLWHLSIKQDKI